MKELFKKDTDKEYARKCKENNVSLAKAKKEIKEMFKDMRKGIMMLKQFEDLEHKAHPSSGRGTRAVMDFDNGYGISVIFGRDWYSNGVDTYEIAVMKDKAICYDTPITEDVIGNLTKQEVSDIMKQIQELQDV